MQPQVFASAGLIVIGLIATALIYWRGAHRIAESESRMNAIRWTVAFAISICTFCGVAPFLTGFATWLLLLPLLGIGLSLDSIERIAAGTRRTASSASTHASR